MSDFREKYIKYNDSIKESRQSKLMELVELAQEPGERGLYEQTIEWRTRRKLRINISAKCENCNRHTKKLYVHHLNYDRYGKERWEDLQVLCGPCHRAFHTENPYHNRHCAKTPITKILTAYDLPPNFI